MTKHRVPRIFGEAEPGSRLPSVADMKLPTPSFFDLEGRRLNRDTRSEASKIVTEGMLKVMRHKVAVAVSDAVLRTEVEATARQDAMTADLHRRHLGDIEALSQSGASHIDESYVREEEDLQKLKDEVEAGADPAYAERRARARMQIGDRLRALQDEATARILEMKTKNIRSITDLSRTRGES